MHNGMAAALLVPRPCSLLYTVQIKASGGILPPEAKSCHAALNLAAKAQRTVAQPAHQLVCHRTHQQMLDEV